MTQTVQEVGEREVPSSARYLTFVLNGERYALDIFHVTEILEHRPLTSVPMMPAFIRGVINLRGRVVPVVDMAIRFHRGQTAINRRSSIVIVEVDGGSKAGGSTQDIGIMVDAVQEVVHLSADDIEPGPAFGAGIRADFIAGMAKRGDDFTVILDVRHVLSVDEMVALSAPDA